jgi:hypothetical protein
MFPDFISPPQLLLRQLRFNIQLKLQDSSSSSSKHSSKKILLL